MAFQGETKFIEDPQIRTLEEALMVFHQETVEDLKTQEQRLKSKHLSIQL